MLGRKPLTADLVVGVGVVVVLCKDAALVPGAGTNAVSTCYQQEAHAQSQEHGQTHPAEEKQWEDLSKAIVALTVQVMGPLAWISAFMLSRPDSRPCSVTSRRW